MFRTGFYYDTDAPLWIIFESVSPFLEVYLKSCSKRKQCLAPPKIIQLRKEITRKKRNSLVVLVSVIVSCSVVVAVSVSVDVVVETSFSVLVLYTVFTVGDLGVSIAILKNI